jgi:hypothetical protein
MGIWNRIKTHLSAGKLKKEQIARLRESIWNALEDGKISDQELVYINGFLQDSELSAQDFQDLKTEIFSQVVQQAIADRRVTEGELKNLNHIIERLEISPEVEKWAEQQTQYYSMIARIESGEPLITIQPVGLVMLKNEVCYLCLPADLIEERVVSRRYSGGSHGVSVRLMKGVSYRVGQQRGQFISQTGLTIVSDGYFIVTNKRLVFSGSRKSVSTNFDKLLDLELYSDTLKIASNSRQKPAFIKFKHDQEAELVAVIISRIINER